MSHQPLVSIIIPTYNRAHIIAETLDSIVEQSYTNWECIVIDDGSTDGTDKLLEDYSKKDLRFQYHNRPSNRPKGGNGARNYGFELSRGQYIQWFDDDDKMHPNKIKTQVFAFLENEVDLIVSKSKYFNSESKFYHYDYKAEDINFETFAMGNVSWVTDDFIVTRYIAKRVRYNEYLLAGQEYNYCCKVLLETKNIYFINEFLTLRRDTQNSIGSNRRSDNFKYLNSRFNAYWLNYLDISNLTVNKKFERFSLITCMSCYLRSKNKINIPSNFHKHLFKVFGYKAFYFIIARLSNFLFGRYYYFYKRFKIIDFESNDK